VRLPSLDPAGLRRHILGADEEIETPYGRRLLVYADYPAAGRCLDFVEDHLRHLARCYGNTHTEDDLTGRRASQLLHVAESVLKAAVGAPPDARIVCAGAGATGALHHLQQVLGVAIPPATRALLAGLWEPFLGARLQEWEAWFRRRRPVVFLGPYEHHSNELTWRESLVEVVTVGLAADGGLDLAALADRLGEPRWQDRPRIGAFSAASNVTGMRTPVHEVARLLHARGAVACFDYAAAAPYVRIRMVPPDGHAGGDPSLDAVVFSPHKFLGGPGSPGVLVFRERLYRRDLPPTVAGGGTVDYVGPRDHDFVADVELREKAGTPPILQTLRAALAVQVKEAVGVERIHAREQAFLVRALRRWQEIPGIRILGNPDPERRLAIVAFNLAAPGGGVLHPRLVTVLLDDLFGIQSRAGCSCAGPYGHVLLGIDQERSERYRELVRRGFLGIKPGWCRVGFHWAMDDAEVDFLIEAVAFLAGEGHRFLPDYRFDLRTGVWRHRRRGGQEEPPFGLAAGLEGIGGREEAPGLEERRARYEEGLAAARREAARLARRPAPPHRLPGVLGVVQFFPLVEACLVC